MGRKDAFDSIKCQMLSKQPSSVEITPLNSYMSKSILRFIPLYYIMYERSGILLPKHVLKNDPLCNRLRVASDPTSAAASLNAFRPAFSCTPPLPGFLFFQPLRPRRVLSLHESRAARASSRAPPLRCAGGPCLTTLAGASFHVVLSSCSPLSIVNFVRPKGGLFLFLFLTILRL